MRLRFLLGLLAACLAIGHSAEQPGELTNPPTPPPIVVIAYGLPAGQPMDACVLRAVFLAVSKAERRTPSPPETSLVH